MTISQYLTAALLAAFILAVVVAAGTRLQLGDWRRFACTREGAVLVADTLCVRPDSSWRLVEPPQK